MLHFLIQIQLNYLFLFALDCINFLVNYLNYMK